MHRTTFGRLLNCALDGLGALIHKPPTTRNETKRRYHVTEPRERSGEIPRELQRPLRTGDQQEAGSNCSIFGLGYEASQFSSASSDAVIVGRARINPTINFQLYWSLTGPGLYSPQFHHHKDPIQHEPPELRSHSITRRSSIRRHSATSEQPQVPSNPVLPHLTSA